jgi:ornithine lipid ester-linked acyl 2-hydroxylase
VRPYLAMAREAEPVEDRSLGAVRRRAALLRSVGVFALLDLNGASVARFAPDLPARWELSEVPWAEALPRSYEHIRAEAEAYLDGPPLPRVAELAGLDPESDVGRKLSSSDRGQFRLIPLFQYGRWVPEVRSAFPQTVAALECIPGLTNAGITTLDPGSHLRAHVDPKGGYRYHLPLVVPGAEGDCRIRIADETIPWREGEAILFNEAVEHEVWNDSDGSRVLLNLGARIPLPFPSSALNRVAQHLYRFSPALHRMPDRAGDYARQRAALTA